MREDIFKYILCIIIGILIGGLLSINSCSGKKTPDEVKIITEIERFTDTLYITTIEYIKNDISIVKTDENAIYDDIHGDNYYNQTFKGDNYSLNTYGGYVDSIDMEIKCIDKIIYDSVKIKETIENTIYNDSKTLWLSCNINYHPLYKVSPEVKLTWNMKKIGMNIGIGYMNGIYVGGGINIKLK